MDFATNGSKSFLRISILGLTFLLQIIGGQQ